jgi:hypothetical protein
MLAKASFAVLGTALLLGCTRTEEANPSRGTPTPEAYTSAVSEPTEEPGPPQKVIEGAFAEIANYRDILETGSDGRQTSKVILDRITGIQKITRGDVMQATGENGIAAGTVMFPIRVDATTERGAAIQRKAYFWRDEFHDWHYLLLP